MLAILQHTPLWVWLLLVGLVALGIAQRRDAIRSEKRAAILPLCMLLFSLYGVSSSFGIGLAVMVCWLVGAVLGIVMGRIVQLPRGVRYDKTSRAFHIPGSWWPLVLILMIFCVKYVVAVVFAINPLAREMFTLIVSMSVLYGLFGGLLFSRWLVIRASMNAGNGV